MFNVVVAVVKRRTRSFDKRVPLIRSAGPLELIQGSLSSKKVARQSPLLAGLHRAVDGALVGVLLTVVLMTTLALHWQHRWTTAFTRLEKTRVLAHRFTDSTAMLERYLLQRSRLPKSMVPTKVSNLLYLDNPSNSSMKVEDGQASVLSEFINLPIHFGY